MEREFGVSWEQDMGELGVCAATRTNYVVREVWRKEARGRSKLAGNN